MSQGNFAGFDWIQTRVFVVAAVVVAVPGRSVAVAAVVSCVQCYGQGVCVDRGWYENGKSFYSRLQDNESSQFRYYDDILPITTHSTLLLLQYCLEGSNYR